VRQQKYKLVKKSVCELSQSRIRKATFISCSINLRMKLINEAVQTHRVEQYMYSFSLADISWCLGFLGIEQLAVRRLARLSGIHFCKHDTTEAVGLDGHTVDLR
jgi:hypothetical protein